MTRVVVLISGSGSNLQAFIDGVADQSLPIEIALVISNQVDAFGLQRAQQAGIQTSTVSHKDFENRETFDKALMQSIDAVNPDLIILAGFMRILTADFVEHYDQRLINIHPSLLPKYPGNNTHQRVLDANDELHGASVHFVVPEVDAGPVIIQGCMSISNDDTKSSLQQRIHKIEHQIFPTAVKWFAMKRLQLVDGQVLLDGKTSPLQLQSFDV